MRALPVVAAHLAPVPLPRQARLRKQGCFLRWAAGWLELLVVLLLFIAQNLVRLAAGELAAPQQEGSLFFRVSLSGLLAAGMLAIAHHGGRALLLLKQSWPVLLLLSWFFLSAAWASHPDLTMKRSFAYVMIYLIGTALAASYESARDFQRPLFWGFVLVFLGNAAVAQFFPPINAELGINGAYAQKNAAGAVALYVIIITSSAIGLAPRLWRKIVPILFLLIAWVFLLLTQAKTAIGTAVLLSATLPFLGYLLSRAKTHMLFAGAVSMFLLSFAFFCFQAFDISGEAVEAAIIGDVTLTDRTVLWSALIPEIRLRPWQGAGFGSFWSTGERLNPISTALPDTWFMQADVISEAHNGFLDIVLQTGFIGLALYLLVILRCIWKLCSAIAAPAIDRNDRIACTMMLGLVLAFVIGNLTESFLFQPSNPVGYLFVLIAVQAERWQARYRSFS
jgi:exopolysaccharide production protein ExoQ